MFERIKRWRDRRQDRRFIQYGFQLARSIIIHITPNKKQELLDTLRELLDNYLKEWGYDDFVEFYKERLDYLSALPTLECGGLYV